MLLNGRPIRDSQYGGLNADIYENFPLEAIERLEVMRGPGSVLYGASAFAGVINIVTRIPCSSREVELHTKVGSFGRVQGNVTAGGVGAQLKFFASVNMLNNDGFGVPNINDEVGGSGTYPFGANGTTAFLQASYRNWTVNTILSDVSKDNVRSVFSYPATTVELVRQYVDVGYHEDLTDTLDFSFNFTFNRFEDDLVITLSNLTDLVDSQDYLFETISHWNPTDRFHFLVGANVDLLKATSKLQPEFYDIWRVSLYTQADVQVTERLKLVGGVQLNRPEESSWAASPRAGAVLSGKRWDLKLLYGEAFRSPFGLDLFLQAPELVGNPSLLPEKVATFDIQTAYHDENLFATLTWYYSRHTDLQTRVGAFPATFVNQGQITYRGIEAEWIYKLSDHWRFEGNGSYQTNVTDSGQKDTTFSPNWMAKFGMAYECQSRGLIVSVFDSYFSTPTAISEINPSVAELNPPAVPYHLLTANMNVHLPTYFDRPDMMDVSLSLFVDNLLDEEVFFPSFARKDINTIPHHAGRGFYGTVTARY